MLCEERRQARRGVFSWLLLCCVVLLACVGGLTLLACACAFHGLLLESLLVSTGLPLRVFVTQVLTASWCVVAPMVACLGRFGLVCALAFRMPFWSPLCVPVDVTHFSQESVKLGLLTSRSPL